MTLEQFVADRPGHLARLEKTLAPLRKTLGDQDYISGSEPAYSDYCVFGMFMWAHCVSRVDLLDAGDPIFKWRERLFGRSEEHTSELQSLMRISYAVFCL